METFKIKIEKKVEETKEISLPHYRKSVAHYYKIYSSDKCIQVTTSEYLNPSISIHNAEMAFVTESVEVTKEEFEKAYYDVQQKINESL